jgi:hypothetical protein
MQPTAPSLKRPNVSTEGLPAAKRARQGDLFGSESQGIFSPLTISDYNEIAQNVVWMNYTDFCKFSSGGRQGPQRPQYVQIGNRVYQMAVKTWLPARSIGVTPLQIRELYNCKANFTYQTAENLQVSAFASIPATHCLATISFEMMFHDGYNAITGDHAAFELSELRSDCQRQLADKYISLGQHLLLDTPSGRVKLTATDVELQNVSSTASWGIIDATTKIHFKPRGGSPISIAHQCEYDRNAKFNFKVSINGDEEGRSRGLLPLSYDALEASVVKALSGNKLHKNQKYSITSEGHRLSITFLGPKRPTVEPHSHYIKSYLYAENPIRFTTGRSIVLLRNDSHIAKELTAEIYAAERVEGNTQLIGKYIDAKELETSFRQAQAEFYAGENLAIQLAAVKVHLKIKSALPLGTVAAREPKGWQHKWSLTAESKISLTTSAAVRWKLMNSLEAVEAGSVSVAIYYKSENPLILNESDMRRAVQSALTKGIARNSTFSIRLAGHNFEAKIIDFDYAKKEGRQAPLEVLGKLQEGTTIKLINSSLNFALISTTSSTDSIALLKQMGLGGLSEAGKRVVSKIVSQRSSSLKVEWERRSSHPIKGILLYGPPGTGKTFLARCIPALLGCGDSHVIQISATEVLSKWVGNSEENIRNLFAPARQAATNFENKGQVVVLIIDEIDGILPIRSDSSNSHRNGLVNEFLSQMDGLKELNNIVIVGTTNRLDQLDPAVRRPGRFDKIIEIKAPDCADRLEILEIHIAAMQKQGLLAPDVILKVIAQKTKRFTGADLRGLVQEAVGYTMERLQRLDNLGEKVSDHPEGLTNMADFEAALTAIKSSRKELLQETPWGMYQ